MAMGPFRMGDLAGNDIGWDIRKRRYVEKPEVTYSRIADRLCERGPLRPEDRRRLVRYEAGRRDAIPDPAVDAMIAAYRKELGIAPRKIGDDEIVERCVFALVNEGARILEEGIAQRASDIDMVYLPATASRSTAAARCSTPTRVGLYNVVRTHAIASRPMPRADAAFWQPAPLLARLAAEGKTFNG